MEITGKLIQAMPTRSGVSQRTGNTWMSREYILEIPGQYVKHFAFTVFGEERLKRFDLRKDETVTVLFDIDAHEYNGRYYNEIRAYDIRRVQQEQQAPSYQEEQTQQPFPPQQEKDGDGSVNDLPF